jgi:hypothetical protein
MGKYGCAGRSGILDEKSLEREGEGEGCGGLGALSNATYIIITLSTEYLRFLGGYLCIAACFTFEGS